jgi:histidyl-tRNA synthetase
MVDEKGLPEEVADKIGEYVRRGGGLREMVDILNRDQELSANEQVQSGPADMDLLVRYLTAMDVIDNVSLDLSLARGLDYYTGLIYEVTTPSGRSNQVGSVAAGGRYNGLVGRYGKQAVPCVGLSFGVDRVFTILDAQQKKNTSDLKSEADVYVMAAGGKGFDGM